MVVFADGNGVFAINMYHICPAHAFLRPIKEIKMQSYKNPRFLIVKQKQYILP
jgi:hypothetical protein